MDHPPHTNFFHHTFCAGQLVSVCSRASWSSDRCTWQCGNTFLISPMEIKDHLERGPLDFRVLCIKWKTHKMFLLRLKCINPLIFTLITKNQWHHCSAFCIHILAISDFTISLMQKVLLCDASVFLRYILYFGRELIMNVML